MEEDDLGVRGHGSSFTRRRQVYGVRRQQMCDHRAEEREVSEGGKYSRLRREGPPELTIWTR